MPRELKLYGMRAAFDEVVAAGLKRQLSVPYIIGELPRAEIAEKRARSVKYQITIARLPLARDLSDFDFTGTPINHGLVRDLAGGAFPRQQRNAVLVGGAGTGRSHLAAAIACGCIRAGARGRFYTAVDLVNRLEAEVRAGRQGRIADQLTPLDFVALDELGYLPFAQSGGQLLFHRISRLDERTSILVTTNLTFAEWRRQLQTRAVSSRPVATFSRLRRWKRVHPMALLMMPKTGSRVCLRLRYRALPSSGQKAHPYEIVR